MAKAYKGKKEKQIKKKEAFVIADAIEWRQPLGREPPLSSQRLPDQLRLHHSF
jgi:hypothetical protein